MRYRVSEDAERDLDEIFLYWATRASLEAADQLTGSPSVSGCSDSIQMRVNLQAASLPV